MSAKYRSKCKYCNAKIAGGVICHNCNTRLRLIRQIQTMLKRLERGEKK